MRSPESEVLHFGPPGVRCPSNEGLPRTPDSDSISQKIQKKINNPPVTTEKKIFSEKKNKNCHCGKLKTFTTSDVHDTWVFVHRGRLTWDDVYSGDMCYLAFLVKMNVKITKEVFRTLWGHSSEIERRRITLKWVEWLESREKGGMNDTFFSNAGFFIEYVLL